MASLQTLRNKGGVIVAVVIGFALLAFILTDLFSSGSQLFGSDKNNVGEIDGKKISYQEYNSELSYMTEIQKISTGDQGAASEEQNEALRNQTWEQMIRQYAFKPNLEKLGLTVTLEELRQLINGEHVSPMIQQMFADPQTGMYNPEFLRSFVANIDQDQTGRLQMFWNYLQQEVTDQSQMLKLKNIIDKAAYVTTFEAEKIQKFESNNYSVRFVADLYSKIADSTVNVSDAEIRAYYDKNKNIYRSYNTRTIDYVLFEARPSEADFVAADKYIRDLTTEFQNADNITQFVTLNSLSPMDNRYYEMGEIKSKLGLAADVDFEANTTEVYGPELDGEQYTVSRISDIKIVPDSVNFSHIAMAPNQKATADSLLAAIRKDGKFAEAAKEFSQDPQSAQNGGLMGSFDPQTMPEVFSKPMISAKKGDLILIETPQSLHIVKINDVKGESRKAQLASIKYNVEISSNTRSMAYAAANDFATAATKGFENAVTEKSLVKRTAVLNPSDREIRGLAQSREAVRWAFNSDKNDVSKVLEFGDNFVITTVSHISEEGLSSVAEVAPFIKSILIKEKKGQMLAEKMAGATSVDELASKLSLSVIETQDVNFGTYIVPEIGLDVAFAGGVCGMDAAKISKPIVGSMAVYAAQITGTTENPISLDLIKARLNAENAQRAFMNAYQAFLQKSDIKDLRYRFY